jgi:hypothetical protein
MINNKNSNVTTKEPEQRERCCSAAASAQAAQDGKEDMEHSTLGNEATMFL